MAKSFIRFNCNIEQDDYSKFLLLQEYFSKLENRKVTLTETFNKIMRDHYDVDIETKKVTIK